MAVYNGAETVREALDSVLAQTFDDWEFVVCDDGSSDLTSSILRDFQRETGDGRVTVLTNPSNQKLAYSLNRCLEVASGHLVARMDADDISVPHRLERQVLYLHQHPEVDLVGTAMRRFDGDVLGEVIYPAAEAPDRYTLGRTINAPFFHATIVARRHVFDRVGNYTVSRMTERTEDLDLWFKFFSEQLEGRNLSDPLYLVRENRAAIRRRTPRTRIADFLVRWQGYRRLGYPLRVYPRIVLNLLKVAVPYSVIDWYRAWTGRRARVDLAREWGTK